MVKMRRRKVEPEEFQMAPMIDMVFLLLVFFMTVSNLAQAQKRIRLELPESHQADIPEDLSDRSAVSVKPAGTLIADEPELRIQVRADRATSFEEVRKVLEACAGAGAYDVIYATYQADS